MWNGVWHVCKWEIFLSWHSTVVRNRQGTVVGFVLLNWKGMLRKNKTCKGFRRDSKMINRMKNKTSEERWKELELLAAFKRGREMTINALTEKMVASWSQSEDRNMQKQEWWEKVMTLTGPTVSRRVTHSHSTPFTPSKFTSYYERFFDIFLLSAAAPDRVEPRPEQ